MKGVGQRNYNFSPKSFPSDPDLRLVGFVKVNNKVDYDLKSHYRLYSHEM